MVACAAESGVRNNRSRSQQYGRGYKNLVCIVRSKVILAKGRLLPRILEVAILWKGYIAVFSHNVNY